MKKIILLLLIVFASGSLCHAESVSVPWEEFKALYK
jgi:hypothetical protein